MTAIDKKFAVSINAGIFDKPDASNRRNHGRGWGPVRSHGAGSRRDHSPRLPDFGAFSQRPPQDTANFTCAGFLAAERRRRHHALQEAQDHAFPFAITAGSFILQRRIPRRGTASWIVFLSEEPIG